MIVPRSDIKSVFGLKSMLYTQEILQQLRARSQDTALVGQKIATPANMVLQRKIVSFFTIFMLPYLPARAALYLHLHQKTSNIQHIAFNFPALPSKSSYHLLTSSYNLQFLMFLKVYIHGVFWSQQTLLTLQLFTVFTPPFGDFWKFWRLAQSLPVTKSVQLDMNYCGNHFGNCGQIIFYFWFLSGSLEPELGRQSKNQNGNLRWHLP